MPVFENARFITCEAEEDKALAQIGLSPLDFMD